METAAGTPSPLASTALPCIPKYTLNESTQKTLETCNMACFFQPLLYPLVVPVMQEGFGINNPELRINQWNPMFVYSFLSIPLNNQIYIHFN